MNSLRIPVFISHVLCGGLLFFFTSQVEAQKTNIVLPVQNKTTSCLTASPDTLDKDLADEEDFDSEGIDSLVSSFFDVEQVFAYRINTPSIGDS
ncbi:MAG: hypothetical protein CVU06_16070, partial [Bacteroidetes bacterium HGW-Bacteroidetes-22]